MGIWNSTIYIHRITGPYANHFYHCTVAYRGWSDRPRVPLLSSRISPLNWLRNVGYCIIHKLEVAHFHVFFLFCFFSMAAVLICPVLVRTMHYLTRVPVNFCSICTIPRATPGTNELFLVLAVLASTSFFGTYCPVCLTDQKD